jgi:MFS family permease
MFQQTTLLYAACFLMDAAAAGMSFAVARRAAELGATAPELGLLGAIWIGVYAVSALVLSRQSERWGRRQVARGGCAGCALAALACGWTTKLPVLLALTSGFGIAMAAFWPTLIAWLSDGARDSVDLNARLRRFSIAWNLGLLFGFAQTGWLFRHWPMSAFAVAGGLVGLNAVLLSLPARAEVPAAIPATVPVNSQPPAGRGFRKTAWLANFALALTMAGTSALFPQLATTLGIPADTHGMMLALGRGAALGVFIFLPMLSFWRQRLWPLWVAQAAAVAGVAILGWADAVPWLALSFLVTGAVSGYTYQASVFFTMEEVEAKGEGGGLHEAVNGLGMAVGPLMAGAFGQRTGLRAPYYLCAGVLGGLVITQMILVAWRRRLNRLAARASD